MIFRISLKKIFSIHQIPGEVYEEKWGFFGILHGSFKIVNTFFTRAKTPSRKVFLYNFANFAALREISYFR